jgi:hypothetical protein
MELLPDSWLEVKHLGDRALTMKTRMNILTYKDTLQHDAKGGIRFAEGDDFHKFFEWRASELINEYEWVQLPSFMELVSKIDADLVSIRHPRKINVDYDYKRIPLAEGCTRPPKNVAEMQRWREASERIRNTGQTSTPMRVHTLVDSVNINLAGGTENAIKRVVHRAIARGLTGCKSFMKYADLVNALGITKKDLQRRRKESFYYNSLADNPMVREIIAQELAKAGINQPHQAYRTLLRQQEF